MVTQIRTPAGGPPDASARGVCSATAAVVAVFRPTPDATHTLPWDQVEARG